ncbi:IS1 family transposase [Thiocystis violacea]|uniref:IS1 family transposase n=1 Tax=Thiocystis violacea TaxID=13725 RepID=UPI003B832C1A
MAEVSVHCPHCHSEKVTKRGKTDRGKQRYSCNNESCSINTFILDYSYQGHLPEVKKKIIDMALNGSGIRDTARVLNVSQTTVINEIKKKESSLSSVNEIALEKLKLSEITVEIQKVEAIEAELDEMWSYVQCKEKPRWLWHAIDHQTGTVLAYVFGRRKDTAFLFLKALLEPFGITRFYTDDWGAYQRHLPAQQQVISKANTQKIERKHLTLRTRIKRLARKTICFSKLETMHDIVIGLFVNRYDFGRCV